MADYSEAYRSYSPPPRTPTTAELQTKVTKLENVVATLAQDYYKNPSDLQTEVTQMRARVKELEATCEELATKNVALKNHLLELQSIFEDGVEDIENLL